MSTEHTPSDLCAEVAEELAQILEGEASERILDHIAECDRCRDARHDAELAQKLVRDAGADYLPPADLETRVLEALDRRGAGEPPTISGTAKTEPVAETERAPAPAEQAVSVTRTVPVEASSESAAETRPEPARPSVPERSLEAVNATRAAPPPAGPAPSFGARIASLASGKRRQVIGGGVAIAAGVAAMLALYAGRPTKHGPQDETGTWRGKVVRVSSAAGGTKGLELCDPSGKSCAGLGVDGPVPAGSLLRTDDRTRAAILLEDGTSVSLDRGSELWLSAGGARQARLGKGAIVADVAHSKDQIARIELPRGHLEVLGTKFALRASPDSAAVEVSRGTVKLVDAENRSVTVRAGEEGRAYAGMPPYVGATSTLGSALAWSEAAIGEPGVEIAARGLGELKAKKPSSNQELSQAVTLTSHSVKVRIVGAVARTEVDETFTNHTGDVLEGIFRFPLPPDAKIERLALDVDGKLEEGAFVDRDRAAAIWRGAIVNAAPELRRQIKDEIVWVPGPWRDPALLEWQRGGRFELRIYPIPKRGARRVILAYTQLIQPTGGVRRYSYPLAHDPSGSTKVSSFGVELQVRGHDEKFGVRSQGYELARSSASGADVLSLVARDFTPAGDLTVEYALPDRDAELAVWSYKPSPEEQAQTAAKPAFKPAAPAAGKAGAAAAAPASASISSDPFVALALRPKLPRAADDAHRAFVVVVDSSRSMFGESYKRASRLAARILRELDPLDRVTLLACDTECRALPSGLQPPSAQLAVEADRFLSGIAPEGASDPSAAITSAVRAAADGNGRALRVIYVGDGMPTVGPIRPAWIARAVERALPPERGSVTAVAIGADSDLDTLSALARGGGGVVLPYVPGQTTAEATYAVLGASYGNALRDVRVELPDGLSEVAPKQVDTLPAGGESLLVARLSKPEVSGTVVLRGKLGKEPFEQRYPVRIVPSAAKGNAFVPRLYAATRIADLERDPNADAKKRAVELSQAYNVASRYTSLLVLESAAMFKAFGLDNTRRTPEWSGEDAAEVATTSGELDVGADKDDGIAAGPLATSGGGGAAPAAKRAASAADEGFGLGTLGRGAGVSASPTAAQPMAAPEPAPPPAPRRIESERAKKEVPALENKRDKTSSSPPVLADPLSPQPFDAPRGRPRTWIPMRRIFERVGSVTSDRLAPRAVTRSAIADAEAALARDENRRELVRKLYTLHALSGDIEQSTTLAERWSSKEPLDPDALTARADLAARRGDRALAIRILGSVVDVRPGDVKAQKRLARLERWAGRPELGCRHALAISELHTSDAQLLAEAVRCARVTGESELASEMLLAADEKTRKAAEAALAKAEPPSDALSGDLRLEASWTGAQDLDLALLDPDGNRISWLGAPTRAVISARDVTSINREGLALRGGKAGDYVIELVRGAGNGPARGEVVVSVAGTRRSLPFVFDGNRLTLGIARIDLEPRLVPLR